MMLRGLSRVAGRASSAAPKRSMSTVKVEFPGAFETHLFDKPDEFAETSKEELLDYFTTMYRMRRMEITCDNEYKARTIRGFCHLYDGQEAIGTGVNAALTFEDSWITSYRCHCIMLARGGTVEMVLAELMGMGTGATGGKGGSMHFYNKKLNFYGGQGIVGAQVPVGTGLAFANKYKTPAGEKMPVAIGCYGDGAANQGQIWEAANMAAIWKLPMIFCIENNQYGMGTSTSRHSSNNDYYTMGNKIPGIKMDGMNVLAVKKGMEKVKDFVSSGNGPMFVEMSTYRYHGHSMSDPGTTYRNRDEIASMRAARDPVEFVKKLLTDQCGASEDELKEIEKVVRKEVADACAKAKAGVPPAMEELTRNIYLDESGKSVMPPFIRMPDFTKSIVSPSM
ncbi:dehydrogenase E1 component-domain-containing protein [Pelagophyceae sp. CCMP2097]|nr:dehydrogenase E1 component-domain-containing protein [Pelagophyceae sp. CCMP2097]